MCIHVRCSMYVRCVSQHCVRDLSSGVASSGWGQFREPRHLSDTNLRSMSKEISCHSTGVKHEDMSR